MTSPLESLISNERAKIDMLRAKIQECERRIATLAAMQTDDDLDAVLARKLGGVAGNASSAAKVQDVPENVVDLFVGPGGITEVKTASSDEPSANAFPKKALNGKTLAMLRFAGTEDKSIDQFMQFTDENGIGKSRQGIRAFLHQYKTAYGLLQSDRDGHFRLSDLGIAFLASLDPPEGGTIPAP